VSDIEVPVEAWASAGEAAAERLARASNDVGLTGVVFLREIETHAPCADTDADTVTDTVTLRVRSNRPLSSPETEIVKARLLDR
ncbi:MAG TPA: hypothetical protein VK860_00510, partial [Ilumatobacteraceae bacterium]|nr:hypothetical protein [Ilumatobacteraceae bacterium]